MIELMVVVGIIGLLLALTMPAVQSAREAARRADCASRLRQVALAVLQYEAVYNRLPSACDREGPILLPPDPEPRVYIASHQFSALATVLPYLDQIPLYHSINFEVTQLDPDAGWGKATIENGTAMRTAVAVFLCPSDGSPLRDGPGTGVNYRANIGEPISYAIHPRGLRGPLQPREWPTLAEVRDGLSQTMLLSEKLRSGPVGSAFDPRTDMLLVPLPVPNDWNLDAYRAACISQARVRGDFRNAGTDWLLGTLSQAAFNVGLPPNGPYPDCAVCNWVGNLGWEAEMSAITGARSNHPGMVQAAMADGSVRAVKDTIREEVWRALGTRAGGEAIPAGEE